MLKKLSIFIASLLAVTSVHAAAKKGEQVAYKKQVATTGQVFQKAFNAHVNKQEAKKKYHNGPAECDPLYPDDLPISFAKQNPSSQEVAFFPNAVAMNKKMAPQQSLGLTFLAGTPQLNSLAIGTPPDTLAYAGPEQIIVAINNDIVSYNKETGERDWVLSIDNASFANADKDFEALFDTFDPRILYDAHCERWYILYDIIEAGADGDNGFYLAASDDKVITPNTKWNLIFIPNATLIPDVNGCPGDIGAFFDFPQLGMDKHALYVSANMLRGGFGDSYITSSSVYVIPKKQWLCDNEPVITAFRAISGYRRLPNPGALNAIDATPIVNYDDDPKFGYYILNPGDLFGQLWLFRVEDAETDHPSITGPIKIDVPTTNASPIGVPDKGNLYAEMGVLETNDDRLLQAHVRDGQLYCSHQVVTDKNGIARFDEGTQMAIGDRKSTRWYQFDLTGDSSGKAKYKEHSYTVPAVIQVGTQYDDRDTETPLNYIYGSIMTNKKHDLVISGTVVGEEIFPKAYVVGRIKSDPRGTLRVGADQQGLIFAEGSGVFTRSLQARDFGNQRWGDYSMVSPDPDGKRMWSIQEIHNGSLEELYVTEILSP